MRPFARASVATASFSATTFGSTGGRPNRVPDYSTRDRHRKSRHHPSLSELRRCAIDGALGDLDIAIEEAVCAGTQSWTGTDSNVVTDDSDP